MRIKKIAPVTPANGNIENTYGTSQTNTYSQEYQNEHNIIVRADIPTTSERVWFKQSKNLLNIKSIISSSANTFEILDNDWMHYVNSSGSSEQVVFPKISVKPNTKYSIFVETKDVTGSPFVILETYNNDTKIDTTYPNTSRVITTGSNINYLKFAITTSGMNTTGNYKTRIMVTKNTEIDNEYEPYIEYKSIQVDNKPFTESVSVGTDENNSKVWFKQSKNLFDKNNVSKLNAYFNEATPTITSSEFNRTLYIPCNENTIYTITIPDGTGAYAIGYTTTTPTIGTSVSGVSNTNRTIITGANAKYLVLRYFQTNNATITEQEALNGIQIEKGSTATAYEPYIRKAININGEDEYYTNEYSTTEQVVGKWINGKPLYRKVFEITNPTSSNTNYVDISSMNIDTVTHLYGYYKTNAGTFGIPFHDSNDNLSVMFISGDNNLYIRGRFGNNYTNIIEVKVVLEYTKTTD